MVGDGVGVWVAEVGGIGRCASAVCSARLFQSFIKRRFSFTTFCACANFVNINISANTLWQSLIKSYDFK